MLAFESLRKESVALLQDLIRIDTSNPPGNEGKTSELLKTIFDREGIECEVLGPKGRESFIARLHGMKEKPRLLLLSHTDVVPVADISRWVHPPFAAETDGEWVYGRGATDDKFGVTVQAMTMILHKRQESKFQSPLLFAATADEECGGRYGAQWLAENVPEKIKAEYVLNEGGGRIFPAGRRTFCTLGFAEKGIYWFRIRAKGKSRHAARPTLGDNANLKMAEAFIRLVNYHPEIIILPEVKETILKFSNAILKEEEKHIEEMLTPSKIDALLDKIATVDEEMAETFRAITRMTISPTVIHGGNKTNIIPDLCEAEIDTRILPGQDGTYALESIRKAIRNPGIEIESIASSPSSQPSPLNTPFLNLLTRTFRRHAGDIDILPQLNAGTTDSRFMRQIGSEAYGFQPQQKIKEIFPGVHGDNEKVDIESVEFTTKFLVDFANDFLK